MNDFQAIFTLIALFTLRFALPALVLFVLVHAARHYYGPDPELAGEAARPRPSH